MPRKLTSAIQKRGQIFSSNAAGGKIPGTEATWAATPSAAGFSDHHSGRRSCLAQSLNLQQELRPVSGGDWGKEAVDKLPELNGCYHQPSLSMSNHH